MGQIKVLSKELAELIAAGEVIERPSSVIKELVENSIDAKATAITVEIKNGGRTFMRISDNGKGMSEEDVSLAFVRHATSKISSQEDLNSIFTLGFRGEALASISAVSKTEVLTKQHNDEYGTHYVIEGTEEKLCEPSGCPDGTTIIIRDLFYNVPARLKFLKKDVTEGNNISSIVSRLALSHPEISFKFIRDNKSEIVTAGDGKLYSAVYSVFGRDFANSLIPVSYSLNGINIEGFTTKPLLSRSNRSMQNFFINNRYVKSVTCMVALEEAYKNNIMTGKFPACVLNISLNPNLVDVNVHPAKTEIRFSDEKLIYDAVYFAIKNALLAHDTPNELKIEQTRNFSEKKLYEVPMDEVTNKQTTIVYKPIESTAVLKSPSAEEAYNKAIFAENSEDVKQTVVSEKISTPVYKNEVITENIVSSDKAVSDNRASEDNKSLESFKYLNKNSFVKKAEPDEIKETEELIVKNEKPKITVLGELFMTYIVAQVDDDMILIDKHAAHERYLFEKIKKDIKSLHSQMLLEPETVLVSYEEYDALINNEEKLSELGFYIEEDTAPNIIVKGIPAALSSCNIADLITEIAQNLLKCMKNPMVSVADELFHSIACRAAIKANDRSTIDELQQIAELVINNDEIRYCPHGRPVMITLSKKDIEKQFRRIV